MNKKVLTIGISSRALFDLEKENIIFQKEGKKKYEEYQEKNRKKLLEKGTAFYLVETLLNLNKHLDDPIFDVIVMSKNSPRTGIRVIDSIANYGLDIRTTAFTEGESLLDYISAFGIDLFLSQSEEDVQQIIDSKKCAAAFIYSPPKNYDNKSAHVKIALDADSVVFSDDSELLFKKEGLEKFREHEKDNVNKPLKPGPFANFLKTVSLVQKSFSNKEDCPIKLILISARDTSTTKRVFNTLEKWGVSINQSFFLGGRSKDEILQANKPHIFFDDQDIHLKDASHHTPVSRVPYKSNSKLNKRNAK